LHDYFQDKDYKLFNSVGEVLLNYDGKTDDGTTSLGDYLEQAYKNQGNIYPNKESFIGNFIKRNVFSSSYLTDHRIVLPRKDNQTHFANFFDVISKNDDKIKDWQYIVAQNYGQIYNFINNDLTKNYNQQNPNNKIFIDENYVIKYNWNNPGYSQTEIENYNLEPINLGYSNNVVSKLSWSRLENMKDNEILVNDKYAQIHNLKIGDKIQINDFKTKDGDFSEPLFNKEYTIIGWGAKIHNLFSEIDFLELDQNKTSKNSGFFYLTNKEFSNYLNYLWYYNNRVVHEDDNRTNIGNQSNYYQRLRVDNNNSILLFNNFLTSQKAKSAPASTNLIRRKLRILFSYDSLNFVQQFKLYIVEGIVFTLIGFISLLFSILFVNYCVKKQLRQMRRQLGLFKALGYRPLELAGVLWSRTYILLLVGVILGYFLSIPVQIYVNHLLAPNFNVIVQEIWLNPYFLCTIFLILPLVLSLFNLAAIVRYLQKNALLMIYMDKNFSLGQGYGIGLSWLIKTHSVHWGKIKFHYSWKEIFMALLIPLFFALGSLLLMTEFNTQTLMTDTIDINSHVYRDDIDHSFTLDKTFNWEKKDDNKYYLNDENINNLHYETYSNRTELQNYHDVELDQKIDRYLASEHPAIAELTDLVNSNINYKAIDFPIFIKLLEKIVHDYETYFQAVAPQYQSTINEIKSALEAAQEFQARLINKEVQLTFNNVFVQNGSDFPILKLDLHNSNSYQSSDGWTLYLVNQTNQIIFSDLDYQQLTRSKNNSQDSKILPVIVSEKFSILNGFKVGDEVISYLNSGDRTNNLRLKIVGVNNDKISNSFYGLEETFINQMVGSTFTNNHFYNTVYSKQKMFDLTGNQIQTLKVNVDYFNFYYSTDKQTVSLLEVFQDEQNLADYLNWRNFGTQNFKSLQFERYIANKSVKDIRILIYILLGFTLVLLLTLFVVFFIIGTVDNYQQIQLMKAFGYRNSEISIKLLWRHIISITLGLILAILVNYFVWWALIRMFYIRFDLLIYNPFRILSTVYSSLIIIGLFFIGSMLALGIIRTISPVIKST